MVLAVYMPPHEPVPGMAFSSMPQKSSCVMRPRENSPTASNTETMLSSLPFQWPALIVPPYT